MRSVEYELFVGHMIKALSANELIMPSSVEHLRKFTGKTGEVYEIDLSYKFRVAEADYLTIVECKCWNHRVGRQVINYFKSVVEDIGAHKGIVVTTVGFQEGAIGFAKKCGIALLKVTDNGTLQVISHFDGDANTATEFLRSKSLSYQGGTLNQTMGLTVMKINVLDYVATRYGREAAAFLGTEGVRFISQIKETETELKTKVITQLHQMDLYWILEYRKVETCGLPLVLEPEFYLRSINLSAAMVIRAVKKAYSAVSNAINARFGYYPNLSWSGGMIELEWKRLFTNNLDHLVRKLFDTVEVGQIEVNIIKDNELERYSDKLLEEGLQVLTTEESSLLLADGGEKFVNWLKC
jgi:hypothetical protein